MDVLKNINARFDHAALKPDVTEEDIVRLCREARQYEFFSVAVNPVWVKTAARELADSKVRILSVSGFPLGAARTDMKVIEAVRGVSDGAHEIDMVANIGWLVSEQYSLALSEIKSVRENLPYNVVLKVIIEAGMLSGHQQVEACRIVADAGAQFVKTCTGFFGGATVKQVSALRDVASGRIEVKASGGIRTLKQCEDLLKAGATRLGSSSSAEIMNELLSNAAGAT